MINKIDILKYFVEKIGNDYDFDEQLKEISKEYRDNNRGIIFSHANQKISNSGKDTHSISLGLLSRISEKSSYENDADFQDMWANLLFVIATQKGVKSFYKKCIDTIDYISGPEVEILDEIMRYSKKDFFKYKRDKNNLPHVEENCIIGVCESQVRIYSLKKLKDYSMNDGLYVINNLMSLGLIEPSSYELDTDTDVSEHTEIQVELNEPDGIRLTVFGVKFWNLIRFGI